MQKESTMQIRINGELIDFTLEKEKTLGDVVSELETWLHGTGFYLYSLKADKTPLPVEEREQWAETAIEDTQELTVETLLHIEQIYNELQVTLNYLQEFIQALREKDGAYAQDLYKEYPAVRSFVSEVLGKSKTGENDHIQKIDALLQASGISSGELADTQELQELVHYLDTLILLITERMREIDSPLDELTALISLLEETNNELRDVSVLLQTGKDREAMLLIAKFTELSQKLLRIYTVLKQKQYIDVSTLSIDGEDFETFYKQLNSFLGELHEAFTINDSVLIGDLFEYEIAPRIEMLITALKDVYLTHQRKEV